MVSMKKLQLSSGKIFEGPDVAQRGEALLSGLSACLPIGRSKVQLSARHPWSPFAEPKAMKNYG